MPRSLLRLRHPHRIRYSLTPPLGAQRNSWGLYAVGIGLTAACGMLYLTLRGLLLLIDAWPGDVTQPHYFCFLRIDCIITPPRGLLNQRTARHSPRLSIPCPCHDTPPFT